MKPTKHHKQAALDLVALSRAASEAHLELRLRHREDTVSCAVMLDEFYAPDGYVRNGLQQVGSVTLWLDGQWVHDHRMMMFASGVGLDLVRAAGIMTPGRIEAHEKTEFAENDRAKRADYLARAKAEYERREAYGKKLDEETAAKSG